MQIEHYLMLFFAVLACLIARRSALAVGGVLASQVPFWVGSSVFFLTGGFAFWHNLATDLLIAFLFLVAAHVWGRWFLIWLSALFAIATIVDIYALAFGLKNYVVMHELIHYLALILIVGRNKVGDFSRLIARYVSGGLARD